MSRQGAVAEPAPPWVDYLPMGRTVLVSFGTVFNRRPELFRTTLEGLADLDVAVAVATGSGVELGGDGSADQAGVRIPSERKKLSGVLASGRVGIAKPVIASLDRPSTDPLE